MDLGTLHQAVEPATASLILAGTYLAGTVATGLLSKAPKTGYGKAPTVQTPGEAPKVSEINQQAAEAADREQLRRRVQGSKQTVLTGPLGQVNEQPSAKTILGGY